METELKLRFEQSTHLMAVLDEPWFKEFLLPDESGVLRFRNRYFDTKDYKFRSKKAVVRVREVEDHPYIHTVKTSAGHADGLHQRFEWNCECDQDEFDPVFFLSQTSLGSDPVSILESVLEPAVHDEFICLFETVFTRTRMLGGYGNSIFEIALDVGEIIAGNKREPICEMEIELIEGDVRDIIAVGEMVQSHCSCVPENMSKFSRAIVMLEAETAE